MNTREPEEYGNHAQELRQRAEESLRGKPVDLDGLNTNDIQYLLHELQVHQAELSIQNEELRRVQMDLEISRDLFSHLFNFAPVGYCTLSQKGRVLNANQTLADMLVVDQEKLLHHMLSEFVDSDSQDQYYLHIQHVTVDHRREVSEIQLVRSDGGRLVARMESTIAQDDPVQLLTILSDVTTQRRLEAQQQASAVRMMLQRRLIEQSEMERAELAHNLHDGPIQRLSGLGFSTQTIKEIIKENGVDGDSIIQQMADDIKSLIVELRGICNDLRPPVLAKLGLRRAIAENVVELQEKYLDTKINLEMNNDPDHLPDHIALALYRIYQHAMNNIYRHAKASEVWIRLFPGPQQILFEIQDNGQGLSGPVDWNEYTQRGHFGLVGMKERAQAFGGNMQLTSKRGEGTTVRVIVPLAVVEK